MTRTVTLALIALDFLVWSPACAFAIDRGQWNHDSETAAWFKSLRNGNGHVIPPEKVLKGTNRVGYPILWWPEHWPEPSCFLPGAKG